MFISHKILLKDIDLDNKDLKEEKKQMINSINSLDRMKKLELKFKKKINLNQ
jgi:hypothetical protein